MHLDEREDENARRQMLALLNIQKAANNTYQLGDSGIEVILGQSPTDEGINLQELALPEKFADLNRIAVDVPFKMPWLIKHHKAVMAHIALGLVATAMLIATLVTINLVLLPTLVFPLTTVIGVTLSLNIIIFGVLALASAFSLPLLTIGLHALVDKLTPAKATKLIKALEGFDLTKMRPLNDEGGPVLEDDDTVAIEAALYGSP